MYRPHKILTTVLMLLLAIVESYSQAVSISESGEDPDNSALLDLISTNKGFLMPRMSQAERDLIASPATGLIIFQNDGDSGFYYFNGSIWVKFSGSSGIIDFSSITTGTNNSSTLTIGSGAEIRLDGNGIVQASEFIGSGSLTGAVDLATGEVSGILPVASGGTGLSSVTEYALLYGNGDGPLTELAPQVGSWLTTDIAGKPQWLSRSSDPSAIFELSSTSQGLLTPRMSEAQKVAIDAPATGLIIYQTDGTEGFYYYDGSDWIRMAASATSTSVGFDDVNSGTNTSATLTIGSGAEILASGMGRIQSTEFIGNGSLTDAVDLATAEVSGTLTVANGGTGLGQVTEYALIYGNGTDPMTELAPIANSWLISNGNGQPLWNKLSTDASAVFELSSTSQGFLAPRMSEAEMLGINSPATGLIVYQIDANSGYYYYDGSAWVSISGWMLGGNSGTDADNDFIGTTDNTDLVMKTNNNENLRLQAADGYVGINDSSPDDQLDVDGNIRISHSTASATFGNSLRFDEPSDYGTNYTEFRARAQDDNYTYTLPAEKADTMNFMVDRNGDGHLEWISPIDMMNWLGEQLHVEPSTSDQYDAKLQDMFIIYKNIGSDLTLTLPDAAQSNGKVYYIRWNLGSSAKKLEVDPFGSQTIDGELTKEFRSKGLIIVSDGVEWYGIATFNE